jgi:hypothetical protein
MAYSVLGDTVNLAARFMQHAAAATTAAVAATAAAATAAVAAATTAEAATAAAAAAATEASPECSIVVCARTREQCLIKVDGNTNGGGGGCSSVDDADTGGIRFAALGSIAVKGKAVRIAALFVFFFGFFSQNRAAL